MYRRIHYANPNLFILRPAQTLLLFTVLACAISYAGQSRAETYTIASTAETQTKTGAFRGNVYDSDRDAILLSFDMYLDPSSSCDITFYLHERASEADPWAVLWSDNQAINAGAAYHSSGPIDAMLTAGNHYGLGVGWDCQATAHGELNSNWVGYDVGFGTFLYEYKDNGYSGSDLNYDTPSDGQTYKCWHQILEVASPDMDGDGWASTDGDCDDEDPSVYPGAEEICDDGLDSNCDGVQDENTDLDGDGFSNCDGDCDDTDPSRCPGCPELCNGGIDDDCDATTIEDADTDHDGFTICDGDCDDLESATYPGANEVCDGVDNNCDGQTDEGYDYDHDGYSSCGDDCDDSNSNVNPGSTEIPYNGVDEDCDGSDLDDLDGDGFGGGEYGEDCDDNDPDINPGVEEICDNGVDDNCNGISDQYDCESEEGTTEEPLAYAGCACTASAGPRPLAGILGLVWLVGIYLTRYRRVG